MMRNELKDRKTHAYLDVYVEGDLVDQDCIANGCCRSIVYGQKPSAA